MPSAILTTNTTGNIFLTGGEQYFLGTGVSHTTTGPAINFTGTGTAGMVISVFGNIFSQNSTAIFLSTTAASNVTGGLEILIGETGSVVAGLNAISISTLIDNTTITNAGFIKGQINFSSTSDSGLFNSGTITQLARGPFAVFSTGTSFDLDNSGEIRSAGSGISATGNVTDILNSGTIIANSTAISIGANASLSNTGVIDSKVGFSALLGQDSQFVNHGDMFGRVALQNGGIATNSGTITSFDGQSLGVGQDAIIDNSGLIQASSAGGVAIAATQRGTINNTGTLFGGTGIELSTGTIQNSGSIDGNLAGINVLGADGANDVISSGTIRADTHGIRMNGNLGGAVTNSGEIISDGFGVTIVGGRNVTVKNTGTIIADQRGIELEFSTSAIRVVNSGLIDAGTNVAVNAYNFNNSTVFGHTVINTGEIIGDILLSEGDDTYNGRNGALEGEISGFEGNDLIIGGMNDDIFLGGNGDDDLRGGGGNDELLGGLGADTIRGQDGDDTINGGDGLNLLFGGRGDDLILGGADRDEVNGGADDDRLEGNGGDDLLRGDKGEDVIVGGLGNDTVRGGFGDDDLFGNAGDDFLTGDQGDDQLTGARGNDRIDGGAGIDTAVYAGDFADYTFLLLNNGDIRVTDNVGNDGVDRVSTVEFFEFDDVTVAAADLFVI